MRQGSAHTCRHWTGRRRMLSLAIPWSGDRRAPRNRARDFKNRSETGNSENHCPKSGGPFHGPIGEGESIGLRHRVDCQGAKMLPYTAVRWRPSLAPPHGRRCNQLSFRQFVLAAGVSRESWHRSTREVACEHNGQAIWSDWALEFARIVNARPGHSIGNFGLATQSQPPGPQNFQPERRRIVATKRATTS